MSESLAGKESQAVLNRFLAYEGEDVLDLSGIRLEHITEELGSKIEQMFPELLELKLNFCNLESLENFPKLSKLIRIELNENLLKEEELNNLTQFSDSLVSISLYKNPVDKLKLIETLKQFKHLEQIDLCGLEDTPEIQYDSGTAWAFFTHIKSLLVFNNRDRNGEEFEMFEGEDFLQGDEDLDFGDFGDDKDSFLEEDEGILGKREISRDLDFHDGIFDLEKTLSNVFKKIKL